MTAQRTHDQEVVLEKIRHHLAELNAKFGFASRLARENHWPSSFAYEVMDEYARFLFIAREGGHPVSPPALIDKAWHLHLLHTDAYWFDFCPNILQMPLHHTPATGTQEEKIRFADWSGQTLLSYRKFFGTPSALWKETSPVDNKSSLRSLSFVVGGIGLGMGLCALFANAVSFVVFGLGFLILSFFLFRSSQETIYRRSIKGDSGTFGGNSCSSTPVSVSLWGDSGSSSTSGHSGHGGHGGSHGGHSCGGGHGCGGHGCGGGGGH